MSLGPSKKVTAVKLDAHVGFNKGTNYHDMGMI